MKIEIKNVKYAAFNSEETHCFEATVYVDGKREFIVSNHGHGGPDNYEPIKGQSGKGVYHRIKEINDELGKKEISFGKGHKIKNCLEIVIGNLVNQWLREKDAKRILKKIAYVKNGDVYTLATRFKPTHENLKAVKQSSWWKSDFILLNELPLREAINHL